MRTYVDLEDVILATKIANGNMFKSIQTKNIIELRTDDLGTGDHSAGVAQFNMVVLGEEYDYTENFPTQKKHFLFSSETFWDNQC